MTGNDEVFVYSGGPDVGCTAIVQAQAVTYDAQQKQWFLQTDHSTYVIGINERNELQSVYWGAKLTRPEDLAPAHSSPEWASFDGSETTTNTEYPGWGGRMYAEPSLKVTLADGVRDLVLKYGSYKIAGDTLAIELKDIKYDLVVTLTYRAYPAEDIVRKSARIENKTHQPITIESAQSGVWYVPRNQHYRLTYAAGRWAGEDQLQQEMVHQGSMVLESRRGNTSHQVNPWFAIDETEAPTRSMEVSGLGRWAGAATGRWCRRDAGSAGARHRRL